MHRTLETQRVPLGESVRCFGKTAVLRRATTASSALFWRAEAKQLAGSAAGCFGDELWFGAPKRRRNPRFGDENLPQTTSGRY